MRPLAVLCLLAAFAFAQGLAFPGGTIVITDSMPPSVWMYDPVAGGSPTLLNNAASILSPGGIVATDQGDCVFTDFQARSISRVDATGTLTPITATPLFNNLTRLDFDHNGNFIVTGNATNSSGGMPGGSPSQVMIVDPTGAQTVIAILTGNPFGVAVHPKGGLTPGGDYIVCIPLIGDVLSIDTAGTMTPLASGVFGPLSPALFPNGDIAVTLSFTDEIIRIPRNGGAPSMFVAAGAGLGNVKDLFADGEGGFYVTEAGGTTGSRLMHVDPVGTVTTILGNSQFGVLQSACMVPHLNAPASPNTGAVLGLQIDFPAHANAGYTTVASVSLHPGIQFPGSDNRSIPINPDAFFLQTFGVGVPGIATGWSGALDGAGRASLLLDLSIFPPGAFSGSRVWLQVGVIDPTAPSNIASLSEVATLAF